MYPQKDPPPPYGPAPPPGQPMMMNPPQPQFQQPQAIVVPMAFGPNPSSLVCPSCHTTINTDVRLESSTRTHLFALLLCFICCPIMWLPYCIDSCQSANHYCPKCGAYLGKYDN